MLSPSARNDLFLLLGRVSFAALFIPDGYAKLENFSRFAESLGRRGLPLPDIWALAAVVSELGGSALLLLGFRVGLGALAIIAFCLIANALQHRYWEMDGSARNMAWLSFYKNLALCGGLLFLSASGPGNWALERFFKRGG